MNFGKRIEAERIAQGFSQQRLCDLAGMTGRSAQQALDSIEKRDSSRTRYAAALARALGLRLEYALTGQGPKFEPWAERWTPADVAPAVSTNEAPEDTRVVERSIDVQIPHLNVQTLKGRNDAAIDSPDAIRSVTVSRRLIRQLLPTMTGPSNLVIVTGHGDSMEPTYRDGDLMVVDTGFKQIDVDGVYVIERDEQLYIKRMQRQVDGSLAMISDNQIYRPQHIADLEADRFHVIGRVLLVWNARRL